MEDTGDDSRVLETEAGHSTFDGEDIYAEDGSIRSDFLMHVGAAIADGDLLFLRRHVARLHESEMGDLLEAIQPEQRRQLVSLLGADFDLAALTEVDEAIRLDIVEHLPNEQIAAAIGEMDSDDAVYILEDLNQEDQEEILSKLPPWWQDSRSRSWQRHPSPALPSSSPLGGRPDQLLLVHPSARPLQRSKRPALALPVCLHPLGTPQALIGHRCMPAPAPRRLRSLVLAFAARAAAPANRA